jgi:hypothetical protein
MSKPPNTDGGQPHSNSPEIDALLQEQRAFAPAEAFRAQANVRDEHG